MKLGQLKRQLRRVQRCRHLLRVYADGNSGRHDERSTGHRSIASRSSTRSPMNYPEEVGPVVPIVPLAQERLQTPLRIALLTNFIPSYRIPVFQEIAGRVASFRVFASTLLEANRHWAVDFGRLEVVVQRNVTLRRTWRHPSGFEETVYLHFPWDTLWQSLRYRPDAVVSGEFGFRTLNAVMYKLLSRSKLTLAIKFHRIQFSLEPEKNCIAGSPKVSVFLEPKNKFCTHNRSALFAVSDGDYGGYGRVDGSIKDPCWIQRILRPFSAEVERRLALPEHIKGRILLCLAGESQCPQ
jgi:hypothetical protein